MGSAVGPQALADPALGADCVRHAKIFFGRPENDLETAVAPTFALAPVDALRRDYAAKASMIFGEVPPFEAVLESVVALEARLNQS